VSDIFLSYAKTDKARAQQLVVALRGSGWTVWWDEDIALGADYMKVISHELSAAKCVIATWSNASVRSSWVPSEAEDARGRGVLLPVLLDTTKVPVPFNVIQHTDLSNWSGDLADSRFQKLLDAVRNMTTARSGGGHDLPSPENAEANSGRWLEGMGHLAEGIPLARNFHGYFRQMEGEIHFQALAKPESGPKGDSGFQWGNLALSRTER
jgi:hypothetical protein